MKSVIDGETSGQRSYILFSLSAKLSDFWTISSQVTGILLYILYRFLIKKTFMGRII